jgi:hypothetical protein
LAAAASSNGVAAPALPEWLIEIEAVAVLDTQRIC